jgi:GNAT superfamily N-acetyltransferase
MVSGRELRVVRRWKHEANPFGRSPAWWVEDGRVVGFRTFMRWEHRTPGGGAPHGPSGRHRDATPSHQGRGIFRRLTLQALDDLRPDGVAFIFNTPNDKSRRGYLKMEWTPVGRLAVGARVAEVSGAHGARPRARRCLVRVV